MRTCIILLLLTTYCVKSAKRTTTASILERIKMLKEQIRNSLRNPSQPDPDPGPEYYESDENSPILPISENDELKIDDKFKLKQLKKDQYKLGLHKTQPTTKLVLRTEKTSPTVITNQGFTTPPITQRFQLDKRVLAISKSLSLHSSSKPAVDIFYRKSYNGPLLNTPAEWLHCSEHVTPYLKGVTKDLTKPRKIQVEDHIVHRLVNLLKTNITKMSRTEKKSVMFQISKLKLRLYSWHYSALNRLLTTIGTYHVKRPKLNFLTLKRGMEKLLQILNADLTNTTRLLVQAKIFRPPCIHSYETGSSKFVPGSTIPVPSLKMPDDSVECVRRDQNQICIF